MGHQCGGNRSKSGLRRPHRRLRLRHRRRHPVTLPQSIVRPVLIPMSFIRDNRANSTKPARSFYALSLKPMAICLRSMLKSLVAIGGSTRLQESFLRHASSSLAWSMGSLRRVQRRLKWYGSWTDIFLKDITIS